jgi:hypothetical protein
VHCAISHTVEECRFRRFRRFRRFSSTGPLGHVSI